jgi:hypothetical protein
MEQNGLTSVIHNQCEWVHHRRVISCGQTTFLLQRYPCQLPIIPFKLAVIHNSLDPTDDWKYIVSQVKTLHAV